MTKEAEALLCLLYANYKQRSKELPRDEARMSGGLDDIQKLVSSEFNIEDTRDICYELSRNGLLEIQDADDTIYNSVLTIDAVTYMQHKTKDEIKKIVSVVFTHLPPALSLIL